MSLYTNIAHDIVHDVVIRFPYIPILRAFFLRYRLVFFDIVVNIGWQGFWVWSVLISGYDIGYDIVGFLRYRSFDLRYRSLYNKGVFGAS